MNIIYIDRQTGKKEIEKVYGEKILNLFYGDRLFSRLLGASFLPIAAKNPVLSKIYGRFQKSPKSAKKIIPFIKDFGVDSSEFLESVDTYKSFNDFFIRKLKPEARPIAPGENIAVIPADGRYYFYQSIHANTGIIVKGEKLNLEELLQNKELAKEYKNGSMLIARLCPSDYHRFHFPCDCLPGYTDVINGWLYSVNPIAIKKNISIFTKNKRTLCQLMTKNFGKVIYMEVGATNVGSIKETYVPFKWQEKGAEKGYFEFGASALIILFPPNTIQFDEDLLKATEEGFEMRCLLGQSLGKAVEIT